MNFNVSLFSDSLPNAAASSLFLAFSDSIVDELLSI